MATLVPETPLTVQTGRCHHRSDQPTTAPCGPTWEECMAALISEIVYRGIFQKNLASRIARGIVLSARKSGRWGIAFGRYGDSPQRNGIPAKGVESWAWYGLQPINRLTVPNGTVLMTSLQSVGELLKDIHRRDEPSKLALIRAKASFSGLWVYKEDHTEVRVLGALAKIAPAFLSLDGVSQAIERKAGALFASAPRT